MEVPKENNKETSPQPSTSTDTVATLKRLKRKRKRIESNSDSSEDEPILPNNYMDVEKNLHAAALKNNLSEQSVKNIIKKVVTNDHVLALVKLQEEEGLEMGDVANRPKLTRSKAKELMKSSPKSAPWNIELTPINHIPVKTRPEVTALIDQDLPDESDEEYEPAPDDVISDDDHTIESSDVDSQPRTPATPHSATKTTPLVVKDGPFKVPQDVNLSVCRRLELEEEAATIALRTRSKLCLSETPIEHIESSFVPPDELPQCEMDSLWNQFLSDLDNPALNHRNEEDDDDPEYNAANDPDAHDEDEESLENSIIKISKKELNDLVTEIFQIMPDGTLEQLAEKNMNNNGDVARNWNGKNEPDSNTEGYEYVLQNAEMPDDGNVYKSLSEKPQDPKANVLGNEQGNNSACNRPKVPPVLQETVEKAVETVEVRLPIEGAVMLPEQKQILEQQLRQHVQVAACNFLQLFIHPIHWSMAPAYRGYLDTLYNTSMENPNSIMNVCNLKPAVELIRTWEETVGDKTPENEAMLAHMEKETIKYRRRHSHNGLYVGEFHETFLQVVSNSSVFLYPYLLPVMPYKPESNKRAQYCQAEDELIALGMSQFWDYIEENPDMYPRPAKIAKNSRWGLADVIELVRTHMFPWLTTRALKNHIHHIKKMKDPHNPINKFLHKREIVPVKHKLLPFNQQLSLYEQPIHEMPFIWVKYIGKHSSRAKEYISKRSRVAGRKPDGVEIKIGELAIAPKKDPLPIHFTKPIIKNRVSHAMKTQEPQPFVMTVTTTPSVAPKTPLTSEPETRVTAPTTAPEPTIPALYSLVQTSNGAFLMPLQMVAATPNKENKTFEITNVPENVNITPENLHINKNYNNDLLAEHCSCCKIIKNIVNVKQTVMTDYFCGKNNKKIVNACPCRRKSLPKITNKLKLLLDSFTNKSFNFWKEFYSKISILKWHQVDNNDLELNNFLISNKKENSYVEDPDYLQDLAFVTKFQIKMWMRISTAKSPYLKKRVHTIFSTYDIGTGDPVFLAQKLERLFNDELLDFFPEFLIFLTEEQVEKINRYKDYFVQNKLEDFVKKIEEEVKNTNKRKHILMHLSQVLSLKTAGSCFICRYVLPHLNGYPKLAEYYFSLFPHRHKDWKSPITTCDIASPEPRKEQENNEKDASTSDSDTSEDPQSSNEATELVSPKTEPMDVEEQVNEYIVIEEISQERTVITQLKEVFTRRTGDETVSENQNQTQPEEKPTQTNDIVQATVKKEYINSDNYEDEQTERNENDPPHASTFNKSINDEKQNEIQSVYIKTEIPDNEYESSSDVSMRIVSDEETATNWTREEDKQILRALQQSLAPLKLIDKTVDEVLTENNVYGSLSTALINKSMTDIKKRVLYLLDLLLLSEKT